MLPSRYFSQCLLHTMDKKDGSYHTYILPFAMELDELKFVELASRLCDAAALNKSHHRKAMIERLKDPRFTQRVTGARLSRAGSGMWSVTGKGSAQYGLKEGRFSVVSSIPCFSD